MKERKFWLEMSNGHKFQIHEGDYNIISGRVVTGKTNGWYGQRFDLPEGELHGWSIQFKEIACFYADAEENVDKIIRDKFIDIEKRKPQPVGKPESPKKPDCNHNWQNPDDWEYVTCIVGGVQRYHKQCNKCGNKSQLIKKREVEVNLEAAGKSINDVPLIEAK